MNYRRLKTGFALLILRLAACATYIAAGQDGDGPPAAPAGPDPELDDSPAAA